ncbi:MAG TPA: hypothetical protein VLJ37_04155 [bacterium]|nr:hypothetical protein [bacterium]
MTATEILEGYFRTLSEIKWKSLDDPSQESRQNQKSDVAKKADYLLTHARVGEAVIEFKEMLDTEEFQTQRKIAYKIERELRGLIPSISFSCFMPSDEPPNDELMAKIKRFLRNVSSSVKDPIEIYFPRDSDLSKGEFVEIQRLSLDGDVLRRIISPPTVSGKYPLTFGSFENSRRPSLPCKLIQNGKYSSLREADLLSSASPLLSLRSIDLEGGHILGPSIGGWTDEPKRIRDNIGKAIKQLKPHEGLKCPLGLITCHFGLMRAEFEDLGDAVMGQKSIVLPVGEGRKVKEDETRLIHGRNRAWLPNKNTTMSFAGWLDWDGSRGFLKIIHNEFAKEKLAYDFLTSSLTEQYIYQLTDSNDHADGTLEQVSSEEELESIRKSNKPVLEKLVKS